MENKSSIRIVCIVLIGIITYLYMVSKWGSNAKKEHKTQQYSESYKNTNFSNGTNPLGFIGKNATYSSTDNYVKYSYIPVRAGEILTYRYSANRKIDFIADSKSNIRIDIVDSFGNKIGDIRGHSQNMSKKISNAVWEIKFKPHGNTYFGIGEKNK